MSEPNEPVALDEAAVRRLVRLLSDALAPDDGRAAKVGRLMAGLSEWIDADGWFWVRSRVPAATGVPENYDFLYGGGLTQQHLATWSERSLEARGRPPENVALRRLMQAGGDFTVRRREIVDDAVWAEPEQQRYVRLMERDDVMFSIRQLDGGGVISYVQLLRRLGKPPFAERDRRLVHAVISECGPLHTDGLNLAVADDVASLTPRQRTVLAMLLDGHGAKQAAQSLGLSTHTVNDHCKAIYRHFRVTSRAELLRRFIHAAQ